MTRYTPSTFTMNPVPLTALPVALGFQPHPRSPYTVTAEYGGLQALRLWPISLSDTTLIDVTVYVDPAAGLAAGVTRVLDANRVYSETPMDPITVESILQSALKGEVFDQHAPSRNAAVNTEGAVVNQPEPKTNAVSTNISVSASVRDDTGSLNVPFDAADYFNTLDEQEFFTWLASSENDYPLPINDQHADDVAYGLRDTNPDIAAFFSAKAFIAHPDGHGQPGFEVDIDADDLQTYALERFPARASEINERFSAHAQMA